MLNLSHMQAQTLGAKRVVGVDIDDTLVRAAWKHRRAVWSQQGSSADSHETPSSESNETVHGSRKRRRLSQSEEEAATPQGAPDYFPASCEHMFGALPIPAAAPHEKAAEAFPHNVVFRAADWVNSGIPDDAEGYDVVIAYVF